MKYYFQHLCAYHIVTFNRFDCHTLTMANFFPFRRPETFERKTKNNRGPPNTTAVEDTRLNSKRSIYKHYNYLPSKYTISILIYVKRNIF